MIHTTFKVCRRVVNLKSSRFPTTVKAIPRVQQVHRVPTTPVTRHLSSPAQLPRRQNVVRFKERGHQVRHCSHQRAMCLKNADISTGSVAAHREVLPTNVKPVHYDLTLEPDLTAFKYDGTVVIEYVQSTQWKLSAAISCYRYPLDAID